MNDLEKRKIVAVTGMVLAVLIVGALKLAFMAFIIIWSLRFLGVSV